MVIVGEPDAYLEQPTAKDVRLVLEITDTTLRHDQVTKSELYACANVLEYWVLILKTRTLEVRRDPALLSESPKHYGYRSLTLYREEDRIMLMFAENVMIQVADLLPNHKGSEEAY
jgi:hypothetical protein